MNSHHASLGRRTLEEIRQKRTAERLSKASSGPDLSKVPVPDGAGIRKSESVNRLSETDVGALYSQLKDLQRKNEGLEDNNKILSLKLQTKESESETLQTRLHELEQSTVPSLRKALKEVAMEKDAAVVLREDLSAQVRTLRKRLKEAEEEQYRAEEDTAALRAELNSMQQQAMNAQFSGMSSVEFKPDQIQNLEREMAILRSELQKESQLRQQERQHLAEEQARISVLASEKLDLEQKLAAAVSKQDIEVSEKVPQKGFSVEDKEKLESRLHDMAVAIERLESSRQKLLAEIDNQSSEIEKLFEENSNLLSSYEEAKDIAKHWEDQVKNCLKQNEVLCGTLDKLRIDHATLMSTKDHSGVVGSSNSHEDGVNGTGSEAHATELLFLKGQLGKEQTRAETLSAQVMQLSVKLQQATQAYNGLARMYTPVLKNIESSLIKLKQDGSVAVQ